LTELQQGGIVWHTPDAVQQQVKYLGQADHMSVLPAC
jgi:hypothetical protein